MARIFISHSGRDNEAAARIKTWLKEQGFETLFLDFDKHAGIPPGADWERTLYREIEQSQAVIIIQTPNWLDSKWCFAEFTQARALGKAIFPVIEAPTGDTLISSDIQALDLRRDRDGGLEQLARQLTRIALDAQGGFAWDATRPPYPGLLAFQEEDAALYFGRDDDIRRLIERLNARRAQGGTKLVALLGASGSGKSSLLRAGAIPRLKRAGRNWIVVPTMRPQVHPVDELARALAVACGQAADNLQGDLLGADFAHVLDGIAGDLRVKAAAGEAQILIPIDQAEELFGASDPYQAGRFLEILSTAMSSELPYIAVMALRSDYLGLLQSAKHLTARFEEFSLGPMALARIPQIIQGPARVAGLRIEEALVNQAARDAETEDALPLLAFALRQLFDRSGGDNYLSLDKYKALGDEKAGLTPLENAVRQAADEVLAEARPADDELQALREAFVPAMVRVNDKGEYVRRPARFDELPPKSHPLLERLAKARLLIVRQDRDSPRVVEVAHEALLRKWPRLRSWLDDAREFLIGKQQLEQDLRDWESAKEADKPGALLTGLKLNRVRTWLAERPQQLTPRERAFGLASIQYAEAEERHKVRLRRNITRGSIAAAVVLAGVAAFAGLQWKKADLEQHEAEKQRNEAIDARGQAEKQTTEAQLQRGRAVSILAREATERGDATTGMIAALSVILPDATGPGARRHVAVTTMALLNAWLHNREVATMIGHTDTVSSAAFSADGTRVVTTSADNAVRVWDAQSGALISELPDGSLGRTTKVRFASVNLDATRVVIADDKTARVWDLSGTAPVPTELDAGDITRVWLSRDGRRMISTSPDGTARVWDARSGTKLAQLRGLTGKVTGASFSADGARVVAASDDGTARVWDAQSGTQLALLRGHKDKVNSASFSADGARVVTASDDGTARVWDAGSGRQIAPLSGHANAVTSALFSPDGTLVVTASMDDTAVVWDAQSGARIAQLLGHRDKVRGASFSPDGTRVVTVSSDETARVWDTQSGNLIVLLHGHTASVGSASFSPDGMRVVTASDDRTARVWDLSGVPRVATVLGGRKGQVYSASFSPDGTRVVTASDDETVRVWDAQSGRQIAPLIMSGHTTVAANPYRPVRDGTQLFSPDGTRLVAASNDGTARIWDAHNGAQLALLRGHMAKVTSVSFSRDGTRVVTASDDKTARVWNAESGDQIALLSGHAEAISRALFSPDGTHVVTASHDGTARVWNANSGDQIAKLPVGGVTSVSFSPNGRRVVTAGDWNAQVWDASSDAVTPLLELKHGARVFSVSFNPDGTRVITGGWDATARVWDANDGHQVFKLVGHVITVTSAAFSPDGKRVVTADWEGHSARIWDLSEAVPVATVLSDHTGPVYSVSFSPDGERVVAASADGTAVVYPVPPDAELVDRASRSVTRCLTINQREELGLPPGLATADADRTRINPPHPPPGPPC